MLKAPEHKRKQTNSVVGRAHSELQERAWFQPEFDAMGICDCGRGADLVGVEFHAPNALAAP